ncbi:MAG: hypothetical protein C0467_24150 [Planctomycetaceae bacterium]|nr:hypothetical protein [Planctomycetaceae bacterium]
MTAVLKLHQEEDVDALAPARPKPAVTPTMPAPEWTTRLVTLLSQLEDRRGRIPERVRGNVKAILDAVEGMIADCEAVAAEATFPEDLNGLQAEALAKAGAFLMATHDSRQAAPTGVFRSLWSVVTTRDDSIAPQIRACLLAGFETLSAYFALFTRAFPTSATARNWVEAASAFLGEFNSQIRELPE